MKRFLVLAFFVFYIPMFSQIDELHFLKGKVICQNVDFTSIIITNQRSQNSLNPEVKGDFSLFVKLGDKLLFEGLAVDTKEIVITKEDLAKKLFTVTLYAKVIPLQDVEIKTYPNINAVSLGILQKPAKIYTPAERKLRTAGEFHWYYPLLIPLGGMPLDGLINGITGRTAMLKKELEVERKELIIKQIEDNFQDSYFTEKLKIPNDYVKAFLFYIADNEELKSTLIEKNKIKTDFVFAKLATEYTTLLKEKENEVEAK